MSKITHIRDKKPKKPLSPSQIAERAYREHFKHVNVEDEPEALASGKVDKDGGFVSERDDDDE